MSLLWPRSSPPPDLGAGQRVDYSRNSHGAITRPTFGQRPISRNQSFTTGAISSAGEWRRGATRPLARTFAPTRREIKSGRPLLDASASRFLFFDSERSDSALCELIRRAKIVWVEVIFFEQLAEVAPLLTGAASRLSDVTVMRGHQPDQVIALEGLDHLLLQRPERTGVVRRPTLSSSCLSTPLRRQQSTGRSSAAF